MRHAGVGFPNGKVDNAAVFALPSPDLLMLSTEGRYHHDAAVRAGKRVLWRAIPRVGKRPAELGWSPARFVAETINLTEAPELPITDFVFANELDLNSERGDKQDDWSGLAQRYALIGGWGLSVVQGLRQWSPGTRIHWPAFTPDHLALDHLASWREAADACQAVDFHAYDSLDKIRGEYQAYRRAFPHKPLFLAEWHCKGDLLEERRVLQWLADIMAADPLFEAAYFFIWRWHNAPGWWDDAWDIEHNPARLALFSDPPVINLPAPVHEPTPEPEVPTVPGPQGLPLGVDVASYQGNPDWQIAHEQGGLIFAITKATEGVAYINPYFARNWFSIKDNGLYRGAYHFARPDANAPEAEAAYFCDAVEAQGLEPGDLLALDFEDGTGDLSGWCLRFLRHVEARVGFKPLIYTAKGYIDGNHLGNRPELAEYGLWLASWQASMPPAPAPWDVIAFWQYADSGAVPGIAGQVDHNVFNGPADRIPLYGKPGAATPPAPEPSGYAVGQGVLDAMAAHGDSPATDETYLTGQYSETFSNSGARYVYVASLGRTFRYDPAA